MYPTRLIFNVAARWQGLLAAPAVALIYCSIGWVALLNWTTPLRAGGGPENVLLLVNKNSKASQTIANHYVRMRKIPPSNVVYLDWRGSVEYCPVRRFRREILEPAVQAVRDRDLVRQIDCFAYSSGFPWAVLLKNDYPELEFPKSVRPTASLTGATYLWRMVLSQDPQIFKSDNNYYAAISTRAAENNAAGSARLVSKTFRSSFWWRRDGQRVARGQQDQGRSYLLSTMLGVTSGRGNSVPEVLNYLSRSVAADGRQPAGTIYLMRNGGVRSRVRDRLFPRTVAELGALGVRAEVLRGVLPNNRQDVQGLVVGADEFDVDAAQIEIQPGAVCEHLTSYGGVLKKDYFQTPLSDFLRRGAAGASGTVVEPTAMQAKFPLPFLHVHYARGCSLAESFYQSVAAPLQLLIVGDPLCHPWAQAPRIILDPPQQPLQGTVQFTPRAADDDRDDVGIFLFYVDGRLEAARRRGEPISWDTTGVADGYHEIRFVGIRTATVATQGRLILPVLVNNSEHRVEFRVAPKGFVSASDELVLTARADGAERLIFLHHERELGRVEGGEGELRLSAGELGSGPVSLSARSDGNVRANSPPVHFVVQ